MLTQERSVLIIVLLLASLALAACQTDASQTASIAPDAVLSPPAASELDAPADVAEITTNGPAAASGQNIRPVAAGPNSAAAGGRPNTANHVLPASSTAELSQYEIEALLFMREEEKLARDVYLFLYELWGQPVFQNIAGSEQAHMDSVLGLINAYGLTDPAAAEAGRFTNTELQALYDQLVEQGSLSLADALRVGALIEEVDILDLEQRLAVTTNAQIVQAFNNLLRGSYNHLRAFVTNLERFAGDTYQPQMMSLEAYESAMSSSLQSGGYGSRAGANDGYGNGGGAGGRGNRGSNGGGLGQASG
jgi:hypothetical protein